MLDKIRTEYAGGDIVEYLRRVQRRLGQDGMRTPLMEIGEILVESTKQRFETSTAPDGTRWAPNSQATYLGLIGQRDTGRSGRLNARGSGRMMAKRPLVQSGLLADSIVWQLVPGGVEVGSPRIYAGVQQFGAQRGEFGTTSRGTPIPWGDIPARRYLGLSDADQAAILGVLGSYLGSADA